MTRRLLAAAGIYAVMLAAVITFDQPPQRAGADNHCPTGCIETDQSTVIEPDVVTVPTRRPWIIGKPSGTSQTISPAYSTAADRPPPGRSR